MVEVEFIYNEKILMIHCQETDILKTICEHFAKKAIIDINSVYFIYGGNPLKEDLSFIAHANSFDLARKKMSIIVITKMFQKTEAAKIKAKQVICPICSENSRIKIENFKVNIFSCKNGHEIKDQFLSEYILTPEIDQTKIICQQCKQKDKGSTFENQFFFCLNCKMNLCPLCKNKHDNSHNRINYDDNIYICSIHNELYNSYCEKCKKDICLLCETEHKDHEIVYYSKIIANKEAKLNELKELRSGIDTLQKDINDIINKLNKFIGYMNILYNINAIIVNKYDMKKEILIY